MPVFSTPGLSIYELLQRLPRDVETDIQFLYGIDDVGSGDSCIVRRERLAIVVLCSAINNGQADDIAIG